MAEHEDAFLHHRNSQFWPESLISSPDTCAKFSQELGHYLPNETVNALGVTTLT